jgi:uncharacterized protein
MASAEWGRRRRRVFVDSGAYLAALDADDEHHRTALEITQIIREQRLQQFTTNAVIFETHALLLSTLGSRIARRFLEQIDRAGPTVIRVRKSDEDRARDVIFQYRDKDFSYADALSFVVMERLGIRYAFTFDADFAQYGFTALSVP